MNKILKFKQSDDVKVFWTSDWHAFHKRDFVWEVRGHKSAEDHTSFIRNKVNEIVRPDDIIINLGDITLNCQEGEFEAFINSINCRNMYLLWGNHNSPIWTIYKRELLKALTGVTQGYVSACLDGWTPPEEIEVYPFRYKNVVLLGNYAEISVDGHYFCASHYPVHVWNHVSDGAKMVCGHSHYGLPFSQADNLDAKILDVGWDGYSRPLSNSEVLTIMNKKAVFSTGDHHMKPTRDD